MSARGTWAIFTFCGDCPVVVGRWQTRAAGVWAAQHLSATGNCTYHVIEQLLPERARFLDDDVEEAWRIQSPPLPDHKPVQSCVENLAPLHKLSLPGGVPR